MAFRSAGKEKMHRDKFTRLYFTYRDLMYAVAYRVLRNEQDAEDAVQQALLQLTKHIGRIGQVDSPKTRAFVATAAKNAAIDLWRVRNRTQAQPIDELAIGQEPAQFADEPLAQALSRLSPREREAIYLHYDTGLSLSEIAALYKTSYDAVRMLLSRARQKLKKELEKIKNEE